MKYNQIKISENRLLFGFTADEAALQKVEKIIDCRDDFKKQEFMWIIIHERMHELFHPAHNISDIMQAKDRWTDIKQHGTTQEGFDIIMRVIKRIML